MCNSIDHVSAADGYGHRERRPAADRLDRAWLRLGATMMTVASLAGAALVAPAALGLAEAGGHVVQLSLDNTVRLNVTLGKSSTVRTSASFADVVVGDPEIADVLPLTDRSLSILGRKIGSTRLSLYGEGKQLVGVFDVEIAYDTSQLAAELASQFPHAGFRVSSVNGRILLSGSAPDAVTLDRAVTIAKQFGPDVINSVKVLQPQQVLLEVRFVEAARAAGRELGIRWESISRNGRGAVIGTANLLSSSTPFGVIFGRLISSGLDVDVLIQSLEDRGVARRLAEPNLVALSGDTASFLAGGEFPFPVQSDRDTISLEFKKFGVGLAFTPTVLADGLINLKIEPEVSQIDPTNAVRVGGVEIPSLIVRRANTTVELRDGQSFAIAGLLQSINTVDQQQLPWIGNVPILGALFRSASYQKRETDLVIIVTPRLVRPTRPGDTVRTPLDNSRPPNDIDFFLHGVSEVTPTMERYFKETEVAGMAIGRPFTGHMLDLPKPTRHRTEAAHVAYKR